MHGNIFFCFRKKLKGKKGNAKEPGKKKAWLEYEGTPVQSLEVWGGTGEHKEGQEFRKTVHANGGKKDDLQWLFKQFQMANKDCMHQSILMTSPRRSSTDNMCWLRGYEWEARRELAFVAIFNTSSCRLFIDCGT